MKKLIMFHGKECPHCHVMLPLADKLSKEEGIKIEKLEVWHNKKNAEKMRKFKDIVKEACDGEFGVPVFVDAKGNTAFCGESSYKEFKKWATKK
ncbi:MAG TPA: hypothetical protein VJH65_02405 [Candidatus Nanoarchaeia archaeon]|nr:hypothetical protein [Candidatus Nanoarchaeia archaeon]